MNDRIDTSTYMRGLINKAEALGYKLLMESEHVCECCALVIANGDNPSCRDYYGHTHGDPIGLWVLGTWALSRAAVFDPQLSKTGRRSLAFKRFYPGRATPFGKSREWK